eukprot:398033-Rhodomonas_salina.1
MAVPARAGCYQKVQQGQAQLEHTRRSEPGPGPGTLRDRCTASLGLRLTRHSDSRASKSWYCDNLTKASCKPRSELAGMVQGSANLNLNFWGPARACEASRTNQVGNLGSSESKVFELQTCFGNRLGFCQPAASARQGTLSCMLCTCKLALRISSPGRRKMAESEALAPCSSNQKVHVTVEPLQL